MFYRIYDLCFSADGTQLIAAAGNKVLVYEALSGSLLHSLKGNVHFKTINSIQKFQLPHLPRSQRYCLLCGIF